MHRLAGSMTVTVGLAAAAASVRDGAAPQIAQLGELLQECGSARFQFLQRVGQRNAFILAYQIPTDQQHEKESGRYRHFHVRDPSVSEVE